MDGVERERYKTPRVVKRGRPSGWSVVVMLPSCAVGVGGFGEREGERGRGKENEERRGGRRRRHIYMETWDWQAQTEHKVR